MTLPLWAWLTLGSVAWVAAIVVAVCWCRAAAIPTPPPGAGRIPARRDDA